MPILDQACELVENAFRDSPRPPNEELLHAECVNDMDIEALNPIRHWRETPDEIIEREYAALLSLSPTGFRHFLPAYLRWALLHPDSPAAVADSTIFALTPQEGELRDFSLSKFSELDGAQRNAVMASLEALRSESDLDVTATYGYWSRPSE